MSVAVPVTEFPPTTLDALNTIDASATCALTVSVGDCLLPPLNDAVIVAVPALTPVTTNVPLDNPVWITTVAGTVATAGLLLESVMLAVDNAAADRVTLACPVPPMAMVVTPSATADTPGPEVGEVVEPHRIVATAISRVNAILTNGLSRRRWIIKGSPSP